MNSAIFELKRDTYRGLSTLGSLQDPQGKFLCWTLEDCVRAWGIKDAKRTAIPATGTVTLYRLSLTMSARFRRVMPIIYTEADKSTLRHAGIEFRGIRMHGANDHEDIEGCIGVARNRVSEQVLERLASGAKGDIVNQWMIQNQCEPMITDLIKQYESKGYTCFLRVTNLSQKS